MPKRARVHCYQTGSTVPDASAPGPSGRAGGRVSGCSCKPYNRRSAGKCMNRDVLRILDANSNRAREALRVMEDSARFVLDDPPTCATLKQLRHDFADA